MEKKKNKMRKSVKVIIGLAIFLIIIFGILLYLNDKKNKELILKNNLKVEQITNHYNEYVKVINDSEMYKYDNSNYYTVGIIYKDQELNLEDIDITKDTKYFHDLKRDIYIKYEDVTPINDLSNYSDRYKNYIVFNKNVVTNDNFTLYDNDNKVFMINKSMTFPIIINNYLDKYYVEYDNRLLSINKEDVKEIIDNKNTTLTNRSYVTTLCYHQVRDNCTDGYVCMSPNYFDKNMKYLSDNNYFTLTMQEMYWYLTGKIQVPKNTVTITFDDGYSWEEAIKILEKYNLHGTGFILTKLDSTIKEINSLNFELQSHTNDMHTVNECRGYGLQGGGILCLSEDKVLSDLNTSREKLNNPIALAFPFYDNNARAIELVKKAGFTMSFVGRAGVYGKAKVGTNLYKIPRMTVWSESLMSYNTWKSFL